MPKHGAVIDVEEWRRHGWMMPACIVGVMLVAIHNYTLGVMMRPLEQEFGWSRAQISIGPMIPSLGAIAMAPWVGAAVDRFGARRVALFGVPAFSAALALLSTAGPSIESWWALYALLGIASMFIFPMVWTAAINARFDRNRGLALAVALAGTGLSASIMPFLATWLLELQGWRGAYVTIGLLCFVIPFPLVFFLFDKGRRPARPAPDKSAKAANRAVVRGQLFSPSYLKLLGAALFFSLATCALTSNAVPILLGEDFDPLTAASIAGLIGVGSILGRLGGGILLDRFDGRFVAAGSVVAPSITAIILLATQESEAAATVACFLLGLAAGAEYDACAYLTARHFGLRNFGALFGLVAGVTLFANGVAPALSNHVYDVTRSYDLVLWALLPLFAIAAWLFIGMGRYPELEREADIVVPGEQPAPA